MWQEKTYEDSGTWPGDPSVKKLPPRYVLVYHRLWSIAIKLITIWEFYKSPVKLLFFNSHLFYLIVVDVVNGYNRGYNSVLHLLVTFNRALIATFILIFSVWLSYFSFCLHNNKITANCKELNIFIKIKNWRSISFFNLFIQNFSN